MHSLIHARRVSFPQYIACSKALTNTQAENNTHEHAWSLPHYRPSFHIQLQCFCCSKPLPWLFPCSPPPCAAEEKAGQKGTRKESHERGQESKKSREGVMPWKRKAVGGREPEQLSSLSQHQECRLLQGNSFYAALIITLCSLPPAVQETPLPAATGKGSGGQPRPPPGVGQPQPRALVGNTRLLAMTRLLADVLQKPQPWARASTGLCDLSQAQQETSKWLQAAAWLRAEAATLGLQHSARQPAWGRGADFHASTHPTDPQGTWKNQEGKLM